jgi:protocatechuate 3,4-dioxygenase alpha subunit
MSAFLRGRAEADVHASLLRGRDRGQRRDPILAVVPEDARHTLIARPGGDGLYTFDIRLQGSNETVFFEA